jgi:hypothetical protein
MVLFSLENDVCSVQYCKIITDVPKITKIDAFSLFQSGISIFQDEETPFTLFTAGLKRLMKQQLSPKFSTTVTNKKDEATNTQTKKNKLTGMQKFQKFNFDAHINKLISAATMYFRDDGQDRYCRECRRYLYTSLRVRTLTDQIHPKKSNLFRLLLYHVRTSSLFGF